MSTLLQQYHAANATDIQPVLNAIINAGPFTFDQPARSELIQLLLKDLKSSKGRISSKDNALALLALKTLGKNPTGSEALGTAQNLSTLLELSAALRCIANALLLIERARSVFITKEVNGGEACMALLQKSTNPDQIFILSRILFLSTVHPSPFIISLVEEKRHGNAVVDLALWHKMAKEAMVDILKFTFNILMHYPKSLENTSDDKKVIGDNWSPKLDSILPPLLRVFHALPPTFPAPVAAPLTHVIHSLITIPVSPALRAQWFGSSPHSSGSSSPKTVPVAVVIPPSPRRKRFFFLQSDTFPCPRWKRPPPQSRSPRPRALCSLCRPAFPLPLALPHPTLRPISWSLQRITQVPGRPRHPPARTHPPRGRIFALLPRRHRAGRPLRARLVKAETGPGSADHSLDDELSPLVVLITRLCLADEPSRTRTRDWLVPADLDRSAAAGSLESRPDMLGRCLRLLSSVYHPRLKDSVGEMLFAMCDSDATTLSTLLGYGNVAGFLFNKGIMNAPPPPATTTSASLSAAAADNINPITGTAQEARAPEPEMTPEEKEREMEKLFVLFDRLERTGTLPPSQNPIRKAMEKAATAPPVVPKDDDE
ncbi:guanine nucleotide exchange factor synembryn-domain-containing protein [Mycena olivaceomarginata]|nr:guanine nucleotide exchange factor synembryn-domain-containing protein [Mycena olivaceomarginata]